MSNIERLLEHTLRHQSERVSTRVEPHSLERRVSQSRALWSGPALAVAASVGLIAIPVTLALNDSGTTADEYDSDDVAANALQDDQASGAREGVSVSGYFADLTTAEYFRAADAVVRGTVTDVAVTPLDVPESSMWYGANERSVTVRVAEVIDGDAPRELTVSAVVSSAEMDVDMIAADAGVFEVGQQYVMVLNLGQAASGTHGSYVTMGENAVAPVEDGKVAWKPSLSAVPLQAGPVELRTLRKAAARSD